MTLTEKVAYLKGLAEGFQLDSEKAENKLVSKIIDILEDISYTVSDLEDEVMEIQDQLDAVDEDLEELEEYVYDDEDCDCGCCDDDEDDDYFDDEELYEVECPACHEIVYLDEEILEEGSTKCPSCDELLEFELDCDCDCEHDNS